MLARRATVVSRGDENGCAASSTSIAAGGLAAGVPLVPPTNERDGRPTNQNTTAAVECFPRFWWGSGSEC